MTFNFVPFRKRVVCTGGANVNGYVVDAAVLPFSQANGTFPIVGTPSGGVITQRIVSTPGTLMAVGDLVIGGIDVLQYTFSGVEGGTRTLRWTFPYTVNNVAVTFLDLDNDSSQERMAIRFYDMAGVVLPWNPDWVVQIGVNVVDQTNGQFGSNLSTPTALTNENQSVGFFVPDTISRLEFDLIKNVSIPSNNRNFLVANPSFCQVGP